jgi:hypothetical protein
MTTRRYLVLGGATLLIAAAIFISCYPGDQLTVGETDTVVTLFDKTADFKTDSTYAMPDTVLHLVAQGERDDISRAYDKTILADIADNMAKLGYTKVANPANANVHMLVAVSVRDYTGVAYTGGWWNYWYGYYPPYWGWYPYYPSYGVTYDYSIGTVFTLMVDPHKPNVNDKPAPPIWIGAVNGLADKTTNSQRIQKGIAQMFAQSKYLGEGK